MHTAVTSDAQQVEVAYATSRWLDDAGVTPTDDERKHLAFIDHSQQHTYVLDGDPAWVRRRVGEALKLLIENGVDVPSDLWTTEDGFPQLWGQAEIAAFANQVADRLAKPRPGRGRFWAWESIAGFPQPVARLTGGSVWLAADIIPYLIDRLSTDRMPNVALDEGIRAEILAEHGVLSAKATAVKYGVGLTTVHRIWRGHR